MFTRHFSTLALLSAFAGWFAPAAQASQTDPNGWRPGPKVEFVVPSGPGAALDAAARKLTRLLEQHELAPSIVVSNKSSAHGILALNVLQRNEKDPHYLMSMTSSLVNSDVIGGLPVPYTDFTPLALLFNEYVTVAVRADSPLKTGHDLINQLRKDPGSLSIGIATTLGNHIHLGIAKPLKAGKVDISRLLVVPYKSSAESMTALLGGHLDVVSATTPNLLAHLASGRVRVLAVGSPKRLGGAFAQIPTWREQGIDAVGQSVQGVMTTKGVTLAQQAYWTNALRTVTQTQEWRDFLETNQWQANFLDPAQASAHLASEYAQTKSLLNELGIHRQ